MSEDMRERLAEKLWSAEQLIPWSRAFMNPEYRYDMEVLFERVDAILALILPEHEKQVREQVAQDLLAVEMVEWTLAGQHAGFEAAKIAREGRAALDAPGGGQNDSTDQKTAQHIGGRANAEDCPACEGTNPPYPFTCPGETCPRCEGSKVEPGTEQEGDRVPGAMAHLPYTGEPCTACQDTGKAPASASPPAPFNPHWPPLRGDQ
jgi:hypothetical protein